MTLGKKLSQYRKVLGISQQQLGDRLNVTPQAVSKWENDLAEPDLTTLKALAELYHITIDELLDTSADSILTSGSTLDVDAVVQNIRGDAPDIEKEEIPPHPIGFCKRCGITVTGENLGEKEPVVTCKKCLAETNEEKKRAAQERITRAIKFELERKENAQKEQARIEAEEKKNKEKAERTINEKKARISKFIKLGSVFGGIAAGLILLLYFILVISNDAFSGGSLIGGIVIGYTAFAFTFLLFFDGVVSDVVLDCFETTINWPGLIFTFDLDGLIWLIGMKILFGVLGFLAALLASVFGIIAGMFLSIFVFPFKLRKIKRNLAVGDDDDLHVW